MELLYNPEQMDAEELRQTFVGRDALIEELLTLIEHQPDGPGVQHAVIIASRGMGKTTVLLMVRLLLAEREFGNRWLPLKFPEESWGIRDTADLWCETLVRIAAATGETELESKALALREAAAPGEDIADAALALVRDWSRRAGKRLLLMIENLDQLFEQFSDEQELARLRDVLMNDGCLMLLGSATSYFHEARGYEQPLYNFFKVYNLNEFDSGEVKSLLSRRAERDGIEDFDKTLAAETQRLKALRHFTGGNPRLVVMLYRVITLTDIGEVHRALQKLLDEITPYYQGKTQSLPPQQRRILDHLARTASEKQEGLTPQQIAQGTRLPPNQVSSQLRRLAESGYVAAAAMRGRNTYYSLSEPLYSVWYQMRFGAEARRRFEWLLTFLKLWYSVEEILNVCKAMDSRFSDSIAAGRFADARAKLETRSYLAEAIPLSRGVSDVWDPVVQGYARLGDKSWLRENLNRANVSQSLRPETLASLREAGFLQAADDGPRAGDGDDGRQPWELDLWEGRYREALAQIDGALAAEPGNAEARVSRVNALVGLGRFAEALECIDFALESEPSNPAWLVEKAGALYNSDRFELALDILDGVLERHGSSADPPLFRLVTRALFNKGVTLGRMGRCEEVVAVYDQVVERLGEASETALRELVARALVNKGATLGRMGRGEEAVAVCDLVVERFGDARETALREQVARALVCKGVTLGQMGRGEKEIAVCDLVVERFGEDRETALREQVAGALFNKGATLGQMGRGEEAVAVYDLLVERFGEASETALREKVAKALVNKGVTLGQMGRGEEEVAAYDRVVERFGEDSETVLREHVAQALFNKGVTLGRMGRSAEEVAVYDQVVERFGGAGEGALKECVAWSLVRKLGALGRLGRSEEAVAVCDQLVDRLDATGETALQEPMALALASKGVALWQSGRLQEALVVWGTVADRFKTSEDAEVRRWVAEALQKKIFVLLDLGLFKNIRSAWIALTEFAAGSKTEQLYRLLPPLSGIVHAGKPELARKLIEESDLDEHLFPLARALDYVISGKPEYIEKLPPELRSVVAEIVKKLPQPKTQPSGTGRAAKSSGAKRRPGSRSRKKLK